MKLLMIPALLLFTFYFPMKMGANGLGIQYAVGWTIVVALVMFGRQIYLSQRGALIGPVYGPFKAFAVGTIMMVPAYYLAYWIWY